MKKKGSFLGGLIVFALIIIILGGIGYLGFNIISNANGGMSGMKMTSNATVTDSGTANADVASIDKNAAATPASSASGSGSISTDTAANQSAANSYKLEQINQEMLNKDNLDGAAAIINTALSKMTLDPYAANPATGSDMNAQGTSDNNQNASGDIAADNSTTVNIYAGASNQTVQMPSMGTSYDADKMQQLHTGLYKVSVGMQLLKQLQDNLQTQIEQASIDTNDEVQFYLNLYYATIQNKNKLNDALSYINQAVDLININPYINANGVVYDPDKMSSLHDSIYTIAQGVVDLNKLNDDLLNQAVKIGNLAQTAYNNQTANTSNMNTMNMGTGSSISVSTIITFVLITLVVIFIIGLLGSIVKLFQSGKQVSNNKPEIDKQ